MPVLIKKDMELLNEYQRNWNKWAREILGVRLDRKQREALWSMQNNRRTTIRSGNARGKDFVAAVGSLCFLYLNIPSKVIETAPTDRQVKDIIMSEISTLHKNAKVDLGGHVWTHRISFEDTNWYLEGFKARDKKIEDWSGYHSPNLMVVVSEASGIEQETFDAIEGILTGNSRLVLTFNPNRAAGEAYESTKSPLYHKFKFSSLNAVNVRAKKILIPGQVDYEWIDEKIRKPGWVMAIDEKEANPKNFDFRWEGRWYRPSELCLVRILGEFPLAGEDSLIPLSWVEMANERWRKVKGKGKGPLRLGVDVAGQGVDLGVHAFRRGDVIEKFETYSKQDHMVTVGKIGNALEKDSEDVALIDAIGEGSGVYSRAVELGLSVESVKGSRSAAGLTDLTEQREFANLRAYLHWAVRDALDPNLGGQLALPPVDELTQDLTSIHWTVKSNGKIIMELGSKLRKTLGRSPDYLVSVINTFFLNVGTGFRYLDPTEKDEDEDEDGDDKEKEKDENYEEEDEEDRRERMFRRLEEDEDDD